MTQRIIGHRAWEIACYYVRDSHDPPSSYQIQVIASQIDLVVRAAARLHRAQEASCNGQLSDERYESERRRFVRVAEQACALLGEATPLHVWECEIGSGDPRGPAGLVRWAQYTQGAHALEYCYGDAWGGGGYCLPGRPARHEP